MARKESVQALVANRRVTSSRNISLVSWREKIRVTSNSFGIKCSVQLYPTAAKDPIHAISAVDLALWDAVGRVRRSLSAMLGGTFYFISHFTTLRPDPKHLMQARRSRVCLCMRPRRDPTLRSSWASGARKSRCHSDRPTDCKA